MGNKIITEKDYWRCTGGLMPVPFQNNGGKAKKKSGETFITKKDTATLSTMDFSCTKLMLIMAILAAIIAVAILATGGAALVVLVAAGAAAGAAYGAVLGSMICGQKVAFARIWESFKSTFKIQGQEAITGKDIMLCPIFGDKITFAPEIKNWYQALAEGGANLIAGVLEGMLAGAAIGLGGGAISGARAAFMQGGTRAVAQASLNVLKSAPVNIFKNYVGTWSSGLGLGLRGTMATESVLRSYGENQSVTGSDFKEGILGMEYGTAHSAKNIATGQGTWQDYAGMALWMTPVHKINDQAKTNSEKTKTTEESTKTHKGTESKVGEKAKGEFEAYESGKTVTRAEVIEFYKKHNSNMDILDIESHIAGIDFTKSIEVIKVEGGEVLYQYTKVNTEGTVLKGDYYADNPNAKPTELGISDKYSVRDPNNGWEQTEQIKTVEQQPVIIKNNVEGLKSTSAEINDTWSLKGESVATEGGGSQIYIPKNQ